MSLNLSVEVVGVRVERF